MNILNKPYKSHTFRNFCSLFIFCMFLYSCCRNIKYQVNIDREPEIKPDYSNITIPPNIAPLNFSIVEDGNKYMVKIYSSSGEKIFIKSTDNKMTIPLVKWKKLLVKTAGRDIYYEVYVKNNGKWNKYKTFVNHITTDPIDNYVVYRLIDPGFEMWGKMGIYQRCLENFSEKPVMVNSLSDNNCINCHSFSKNNSHTMLFHMRGKLAGTIIFRNGKIKKVNTKTDEIISSGVYPSWHPDGRLVAFSVNRITQIFHAVPNKRIEVIDTLSDLVIYDTETNIVSQCEAIASKEHFETFPNWSPDGKYLYYCCAKARNKNQYNKIKYDLLRVSFDPLTYRFGKVDTIISSAKTGMSVSFPVVSPDGKYILFCMTEYGNFTIWHSDSDLYLINIEENKIIKPDIINSDKSDSYHTWSSNGRWIVFDSRRDDGLFTRLWITYFGLDQKFSKPFILPQKNPQHNESFLKSYNRPEFISTKLTLNPRIISKYVKEDALPSTFRPCE